MAREKRYASLHAAEIADGVIIAQARTSDVFPKFGGPKTLPANVGAKSCGEIFDEFMRPEEALVARGDLALVTLHRIGGYSIPSGNPRWGACPFWRSSIR